MGLDATDFADESSRQHAPKPHQFLGKYYDYLKHGNEDLKSLLAAHFFSVTPKLYGNVESEFFKKVILPFILENVQLTEGDGKPIVDHSDVTILNTIIELLPYAFETKDLLHTFHHKNGIKYLECLVLHDEFGRSSMKVLQLLASSGDGRKIFGIFEEKSVRIARNLSGKSKLSKSLKELSVEVVCIRAVDALLNAGRKLFEDLQGRTDDQKDPQVVSLFLNLMKVYNELVADCDYFTEEFLKREWPERCFELLQDLTDHVEAIKEAVRDKGKDETDSGKKTADGLGMIKRNKIAELEILLPMCLRFAGHGSSYKVCSALLVIH